MVIVRTPSPMFRHSPVHGTQLTSPFSSPLLFCPAQTIEPGVYVPEYDSFPKHFRGLAMRVEDEVVVGEDDFVVLSVDAPKEVADVEACCQGLLESRQA